MSPRKSASTSRSVAIILIVVLAAVATGLVVFALRQPDVEGAGQTPTPEVTGPPAAGSSPTPEPSATPTPTGVPVTSTAGPAERYISLGDQGVAIRSTAGACGGVAPVVELSADGGQTWSPTALPAEYQVRQVVAVGAASADRLDVVVLQGDTCAPMFLSTFTGGEFWQSYPEQLATASYLISGPPSSLVISGGVQSAPCEVPWELSVSGQQSAVRCSTGVAAAADGGAWAAISGEVPDAIVWSAGALLGLRTSDACAGFEVVDVPLDSSDIRGCVPVADAAAPVAMAANSTGVLLWSGDQLFASADGGATWSDL